MNKKSVKMYWIIPVLYLAVILLLLFLHFTGKEEFQESPRGELQLSGIRSTVNKRKPELTSLKINYRDIEFNLTSSNPFIIEEKGAQVPQKLLSYTVMEWGFRLLFKSSQKEEVILDIKNRGTDGDKLLIEYTPPKGFTGALILPVMIGNGVLKTASIPLLLLKGEKHSYFLWKETPFQGEYINNRLSLRFPEGTTSYSVYLDKPEETNPYLFWYSEQGFHGEEKEYKEVVKNYLDRGYANWSTTGFSATEKKWIDGAGGATRYDKIGAPLMVEGLTRNEYLKSYYRYSAFINGHPELASGEVLNPVSPFMGYLETNLPIAVTGAREQLKQIEELIRQGNPEVLQREDLVLLILNNGRISEIDNLIENIILPLKPETITPLEAIGLLKAASDVARWLPEKESYFTGTENIINQVILPAIRISPNGLFLEHSGRLSIPLTLKGGILLADYGKKHKNRNLEAMGYNLSLSGLKQADEEGFLPEYPGGAKKLYPEDIYPYISPNEFIPKTIPLYPALKPGCWIYTASHLQSLKAGAKSFSLELKYPAGQIHHLAIQDIESVSAVVFRGAIKPPSPDYMYSLEGWFFNEESKTIFMKILHYADIQKIEIFY